MKKIAVAGLAIAALAFAPHAAADIPGIDPFTGPGTRSPGILTINSLIGWLTRRRHLRLPKRLRRARRLCRRTARHRGLHNYISLG